MSASLSFRTITVATPDPQENVTEGQGQLRGFALF
jgi:hypothetical protein